MFANRIRGVHLAFLAVAVVAVSACTESPTGAGQTGVQARRERGRGEGRHFSSEKYRDRGEHPATGRSGSAALQAEALFDNAGGITLAVTSFRAADLSTAAGDISKIQVKAFSSGRLLLTRNYSGALVGNTFSTSYSGLPSNVMFQVQANVRGIEGRRTDVVTAGPAGHRRPDLAVTAITLPGTAIVNTPTIISATIAELNGQRGARGDCQLSVDGAVVDQATGIWVDAGDVVSCVFTYGFESTGSKRVSVRVGHVTPADANPGNNTAETHVVVVAPDPGAPGPSFTFFADIRDVVFQRADTFSTTWTFQNGALFLQQTSAFDSSGTEQSAMFNGTIAARVTFPLTRVDLAQTSGGNLLHSARYDGMLSDSTSSTGADCAARAEVGTGVGFFICSHVEGFTTVTYLRNAGTVTFMSNSYSKTWNGESFDESTWMDNGSSTTGLLTTWGSAFTFNVVVADGGTIYSAAVTVPLTAATTSDIVPKSCGSSTISIPPDLLNAESCFSSLFTQTGRIGTVSGTGTTILPPTP